MLAGAAIGFCQMFPPSETEAESPGNQKRANGLQDHPPGSLTGEFVTRFELAEAIDRVSARAREEMDSRFRAQDQAIAALHELTAHTGDLVDRLLQRMDASADGYDTSEESFQPSPVGAIFNR